MKALFVAALLVAAAVAAPAIHSVTKTKDGRARMVFGELGSVADLSARAVAHHVKGSGVVRELFQMTGDEDLVFRVLHRSEKVWTFRFDQFLHDLPVFGGELSVHVTPSTLEVHGLSGNVLNRVPAPDAAEPLTDAAIVMLVQKHGHRGLKVTSPATLQYVVDDEDAGRLVYHFEVLSGKDTSYRADESPRGLQPFDVYVDAITGELVMDIPRYQNALYRQVFDEQHSTDLPGTLVRKEGQPMTSDPAVNEAYDNAGDCYTYYKNIFNRDSWDNNGSPLNSSVHYSVKYNNAFWNGEQMVYGDGDGGNFTDFTNDLTVICHELSHAVTQSTSGLRYWYESGALNEAFSDIMGASSAVYIADPYTNTPDPAIAWIIGHNVTLVNFNPTGCPDCPLGLRYMYNPALDGVSRDYYPDRFTGFTDERGVHWNSGIANLAYYLTTSGGVHPQQKTTNFVLPIGIDKAEQTYYLGFTQYLTKSSQFIDARAATIQAAKVLGYSQSIQDSVAGAWTAVGVVPE